MITVVNVLIIATNVNFSYQILIKEIDKLTLKELLGVVSLRS